MEDMDIMIRVRELLPRSDLKPSQDQIASLETWTVDNYKMG
jgi:hypothetical protein